MLDIDTPLSSSSFIYSLGVFGATIGSTISSKFARFAVDIFSRDDAEEMLEILEDAISELAYDYLLSEKELEEFLFSIEKKINPKFLRKMYQVGRGNYSKCKEFAYNELKSIAKNIIAKREKISLPPERKIIKMLNIKEN